MTEFRTFHTFSPTSGFSAPLQLSNRGGTDPYVGVYDATGDIVLYIGVQSETSEYVVAQKSGEAWAATERVPFNGSANGSDIVLDPIRSDLVELRFSNGRRVVFRTAASFDQFRHVSGVGEWSVTAASQAGLEEAIKSKVVTNVYDLPVQGPRFAGDLIFDFGMHNATDAEFYLKKGFRVVAVDANPLLARSASLRLLPWINAGRLVILNLGVGPKAGSLPFYINATHSEWSSFDKEIGSRGHPVETVEVRVAEARDLFDIFGVPYYLKIDIEGFDDLVVSAAASLKAPPTYLSFENGNPASFEVLVAAGYSQFKLVNQRTVPEILPSLPPREGLAVDGRFPPGSSGPFGEETPGAWLDADAMRDALRKHFARLSARSGPDIDWWDLHARYRR